MGVEERIGYFEQIGIVRDVIQSHLLQVLALVTMDIPLEGSAKSLQREKNNIIESIRCNKDPRHIVIGQYKSYRDHDRVSNRSRTETYAALRLFFDRQQWSGVPLYIRTGKKLKKKETYVVIELKKFPFQAEHEEPNRIIISFYPQPEIRIHLVNYQEGIAQYQDIRSSASIACNIDGCLPAHGDLILDVLQKERMHFLSFAEILSSWDLVDRIVKHMESKAVKLHRYDDGGNGPKAAERLVNWILLR